MLNARKRTSIAVGTAMLLGCCAAANAALIVPGGALLAPPEPDPTGGTVVGTASSVFSSAQGSGHYSGTLTTTVIRDDPSNPNAGIGDSNPAHHGLTFVYQIHNDATSATSLERMTIVDFSSLLTDVSYQAPTTGLAPTSVDRSSGSGTIIGWSFTGAPFGLGRIAPGTDTAPLVVQTNVSLFGDTTANLIDGAVTSASSLGPDLSLILPEPGSLFLLAGAAFISARRRRA